MKVLLLAVLGYFVLKNTGLHEKRSTKTGKPIGAGVSRPPGMRNPWSLL